MILIVIRLCMIFALSLKAAPSRVLDRASSQLSPVFSTVFSLARPALRYLSSWRLFILFIQSFMCLNQSP
jgi:hypothetical protein